MKNKIKEVQDYFKAKIIAGDFEIKSFDHHTATILIDDEYEFFMWIANEAYAYRVYEDGGSFMNIQFKSDSEKLKAWKSIDKLIGSKRKAKELAEKRKQLEQLKKELGES